MKNKAEYRLLAITSGSQLALLGHSSLLITYWMSDGVEVQPLRSLSTTLGRLATMLLLATAASAHYVLQ